MFLLLLIAVYAAVFIVCRRQRLIEFRLDNLAFLILVVAGLHGVVAFPYVGIFSAVGPWEYTIVYSLVYISIWGGFRLAKLFEHVYRRLPFDPVIPERVPNMAAAGVALAVIVVGTGLSLYGYYQKVGWNPAAGIISMFSGVNTANEMWSGDGAMAWGAGRGGGGSEGGILQYIARWLSLLPLLVLPFFGWRWLRLAAIPFISIKLMSLTSGYSSRTGFVIWGGMLFYYINHQIRRFRKREVLLMLTAGFIIIQVLHMARLGDVKLSDLTSIDRISNGFELATIDTLEPTGWGFRAYESLGIFPIGKKMDHFQSYFGSAVPRFLWPDKPFYSFEPDLTIQMTGNDISGNNPVRTFTIVAEGLLLGGYFGVVFICVGYAFFTVAVERYMTRFWEFTFIRYWWILMAVIMYRTSLFTLFSSAFILAVLPMLILGSVLRTLFISGETSGVAVPPGIRTELGIRPTPPLGMRGASQPIRRG